MVPDEIRLAGTSANLVQLDTWFENWCRAHDIAAKTTAALRLVLHELAANTVTHGAVAATLQARAEATPTRVTIALEDDAPAFDPVAAASAPLAGTLDDAPIGGLGLHLIHSNAAVLTYRRDAGWNRVVVVGLR